MYKKKDAIEMINPNIVNNILYLLSDIITIKSFHQLIIFLENLTVASSIGLFIIFDIKKASLLEIFNLSLVPSYFINSNEFPLQSSTIHNFSIKVEETL